VRVVLVRLQLWRTVKVELFHFNFFERRFFLNLFDGCEFNLKLFFFGNLLETSISLLHGLLDFIKLLVKFSVLIKERLTILSSVSQALNWLCRGLLLLLLPLTVLERHALRLNVQILLLMRI